MNFVTNDAIVSSTVHNSTDFSLEISQYSHDNFLLRENGSNVNVLFTAYYMQMSFSTLPVQYAN